MLDQIVALAGALLLFPLIIWVPGMVLGHSANLLGFRARSVIAQAGLGLLLSMAICPILVYLLVRVGGFPLVWTAYGAVWACAAVIAVRARAQMGAALRKLISSHRGAMVLVGAWVVVGALSEIDFVSSGGVLRSLNTIDSVEHVAFTAALTRTGIPPINPFVYPGHPVHLFFYYLWYLLCSVVDRLGGPVVTARAAVEAGAIYIGLGVAASIAVYLEVFGSRILPGLRRIRTGVGLALLTVTGLDLIPWGFLYLMQAVFHKGSGAGKSIEWWNEQITAWLGAIIMSPHHPAGLVVCLTGVALLLGLMDRAAESRKGFAIAAASLAFASAAGISLYVTFATAAGLALWVAVAVRRGWWEYVTPVCIVGGLAGSLYLPFALELRSAYHGGGLPLAVTIRAFLPVDYWLPSILRVLKTMPAAVYALRLVLLPVNYFAELGFFLVTTVLFWRWRRSMGKPLAPEELVLACLAAGSVLVCTFLRSTFRWNDLGWRGFLVAQFVFLLWAIPVAQSLFYRSEEQEIVPARWRRLVWVCLVIGVAGTTGELLSFRFNPDGPGGPETVASRDTYIWLNRHTPPETIVLFNPDVYIEYFNNLYGYRQAVTAGRAYGAFYGVGAAADKALEEGIEVFSRDCPLEKMKAMCDRYHVGAVVVESSDPVWKEPSSWVWKLQPAFATASSRVFTLGPNLLQPEIQHDR